MELNRIYNIDCAKGLRELPDGSIDVVVTSPPYNKGFFNKTAKTNQVWKGFAIDYDQCTDNIPLDEYEAWLISIIDTLMDKLKDGGSVFFNHKPIRYKNSVYHPLRFILRSKAVLYQEIIWNRKNSPNIRKDILVPCTERIFWLTKGKPTVYRDQMEKDYISEVWSISARPQKTTRPRFLSISRLTVLSSPQPRAG